ncbi:molybdate ABC transporter substrate-binding protein [Clostridium sp. CX1]|uniref:molybdate ABC transporter substrate-binding protein n=1 Tax=Clostridium sp. CX1 TaxID=2978346 RepID=UPI0021C035E0|nr:molybdate ABC transporter substrate-binding protein [Clostridium sp. CX1]MCT8975649.1 molybdate ABC transporter substrate-binding protein [Clostridium sp. CX1]
MKGFKKTLLSTLIFATLAMSVGCGSTNASTSQSKNEEAVTLTISAAASLKDAMGEIKQLYTKENPKVKITYNFGGSGTLQQQIEQGAPADIFMSAAAKQMDALKSKNLMEEGTVKNLLQNDVVLIVPKDSTVVKDFNGIAGDKVKKVALGEPKSVPVGQYSQEILTSLKISDKVQPKSIFAKDVKEVLTWVETGNVDAGLVYLTDAKVSDKVKVAATAPESSHKPVVYPVGVVKASKNIETAKDFVKFMEGDEAKAVFEKYGFKVAR